MFTKRVHVFKAGDQTSAQGVSRKFTPKELQQVVDTYNPQIHEAPLVLGHQGDNDSLPSYGWIQNFERVGDNLYADVAFTDVAKDLVKDGHYRKVSISFYSPESQINPHKGKWSARHLALLGASPPAVKGLEPFSFAELEGCFDFAVALSPEDIFDEDLGPTLIVEKSPIEMLKEKLEEVRNEVSSAVEDLKQSNDDQSTQETDGASAPKAASEIASPDNPSSEYRETRREGTEIAQQTADLEDNFPEDQFMEDGKISRKHAKGAGGQVMQVVENVYKESKAERKAAADRGFEAKRMRKEGRTEEAKEVAHYGKEEDELLSKDHKESTAERKAAADRAFEAKRQASEGKTRMARETKRIGKQEDKLIAADHAELEYDEDPSGRYETARSSVNGYADRMKTGKADAKGDVERMKTAKSGAQDKDRMHTAEDGEQDRDRLHTAKASKSDADGESRWAGQADGYDQVTNNNQYDAGLEDYPEPNRAKKSDGTDPYGRDETETKIPTESEEMPDDEVFAVQTTNVMSDNNMRVIRQKSSDARAKSAKMHDLLYAEPEADEMTGEAGVTTARKGMNASRTVEHAEYETDDADGDSLESLREDIGDGKKSKNRQLTPGAMDDTDTPAEIVGPSGAFAESYKGEPKAKSKQLTPGAMDRVDEADQITGPSGVYGEASLESLRENIGDGKKSKAKQLTPGAMDTITDPAEVSKKSGGVFAENHAEGKKDPYTKTGFGSTYDEGEGDTGVDEADEDYNEFSTDHCGMEYGMGSMGQARATGFPQQMFDELQSLKAKYAELERQHAEEKMRARRDKLSSAIGHLYTEGRLTDGIIAEQELLSYVEGLEFGTLEFSEGETPASKLLNILANLPPMVHYGEVAAGGTFQYSEEDLDPHQRALKLVEAEGIDYVEALKKTMFS